MFKNKASFLWNSVQSLDFATERRHRIGIANLARQGGRSTSQIGERRPSNKVNNTYDGRRPVYHTERPHLYTACARRA